MYEMSKDPAREPLVWTGTQVDLVTVVLAMAKISADVDEIGERMVRSIVFDLAPYPDFRSMRLALQDQCDPDAFMKMGRLLVRQELDIINALDDVGISLDTETHGLGQTVELFNSLGVSTKTMDVVEPSNKFVSLPSPDKPWLKMTWHAGLADFTQLVLMTEIMGVFDEEEAGLDCEAIFRRYCLNMDIDLENFSDFRSLSAVYLSFFDVELLSAKEERLVRAYEVTQNMHVGPTIRPLGDFMVQKVFHTEVANALVKIWGHADPDDLAFLFDMLFITDEMIDQVLGNS